MALLTALLGILLLVLCLLSMPVEVEYHFDNRVTPSHMTRISWLNGLVFFNFGSTEGLHRGKDESAQQKVVEDMVKVYVDGKSGRQSRKNIRGKRGAHFIEFIACEGVIRQLYILLLDLLSVASVKSLRFKIWFGLDDPADTGALCALLMPALSALFAIPRANVKVQPVFDREILRANLHVLIGLVPIKCLKAMLQFLFSKAILAALWLLVLKRGE